MARGDGCELRVISEALAVRRDTGRTAVTALRRSVSGIAGRTSAYETVIGQHDAVAAVERNMAEVLERHRASVIESDVHLVQRQRTGLSVGGGVRSAAVIVDADDGSRAAMKQHIAEQQAPDEQSDEGLVRRTCSNRLLELGDRFDASRTCGKVRDG